MLKKKMFRDIKGNVSQYITIFLMVLIGVMVYSGIEAYMLGMTTTADKFYGKNNLQDLNVIGENFTCDDLDNIKKLSNVNDAERKLSITGTTDEDKTLLLNFIESNNIGKFYVIDGKGFDLNKSGVWLDNFYAIENNISVGDTIAVRYEGIDLKEKVLGLINVPDHLYDTRDGSELYPDRKEFGFAYLSINEIPESFIKENAMKKLGIDDKKMFDMMVPDFNYKDYLVFNYVMVDVDKEENKDSVKSNIEDKVSNAKAVIDIKDTSSYVTYQGEIDEGKTYIGVFSGIFLFIALLSVVTTMTRVVKNERVNIGTLKALGFSNRKVLFNYIGYGFWISLIASVFGLVLGYFFIGNVFMNLQMSFFEIPNGKPVIAYSSYLVAALVVVVIALISFYTCRGILKENPAETLKNQMPNVKNKSLNITSKGVFKRFNFSILWNVRDMMRNKIRTFMGVVGVASCAMLIVCALGMLDSMNYFVDLQFDRLYNFDYKLNLKEGITKEEVRFLEDEYGDKTSKTYGIEIKSGGKRESNNIFVTDAKDYVRFVDKNDKFTLVNSNKGVYVTYKLASTKGYNLGDKITWHIYGDSKYYTSEIVGFNRDPQNQNITMTRRYLESLGVEYIPDAMYTNKDLGKVKEIKNVETIQNILSLKDGMNNMLSMMKEMLVLIIGVAVVLGCVIIYNLGILSYTEKEYQFATLKVLGFSDKRIKNIFTKQNNWIAIISIVIGIPFGYYLTDWLFKTAIEEHYDFGANITIRTYVIAAIGTFIVSYLVSRFLARKIKNIDMVTSLKGNE